MITSSKISSPAHHPYLQMVAGCVPDETPYLPIQKLHFLKGVRPSTIGLHGLVEQLGPDLLLGPGEIAATSFDLHGHEQTSPVGEFWSKPIETNWTGHEFGKDHWRNA